MNLTQNGRIKIKGTFTCMTWGTGVRSNNRIIYCSTGTGGTRAWFTFDGGAFTFYNWLEMVGWSGNNI